MAVAGTALGVVVAAVVASGLLRPGCVDRTRVGHLQPGATQCRSGEQQRDCEQPRLAEKPDHAAKVSLRFG